MENKHNLVQWENLYLERTSSNYVIKNRRGDTIKFMEEGVNEIFD